MLRSTAGLMVSVRINFHISEQTECYLVVWVVKPTGGVHGLVCRVLFLGHNIPRYSDGPGSSSASAFDWPRFFLSGGILLIALRIYGSQLPDAVELLLTAFYGLLALGGGNGALVFAEQWVPSGIAALFVSTSPFWMVGIEAARRKWRELRASTIIGIAIGFGGILVLLGPAPLGAGLGPVLDQGLPCAPGRRFPLVPWIGATEEAAHLRASSGQRRDSAVGDRFAGLPVALFRTWHAVNWHSRGFWAIAYLVYSVRLSDTARISTRWNICRYRWCRHMRMRIRLWPFFSDGCFIASHSAGAKPRPWR